METAAMRFDSATKAATPISRTIVTEAGAGRGGDIGL